MAESSEITTSPHYACGSCRNLLSFHTSLAFRPGTDPFSFLVGILGEGLVFKTLANVENDPEPRQIDFIGGRFRNQVCARCTLEVGWLDVGLRFHQVHVANGGIRLTEGMGMLMKNVITMWNGYFENAQYATSILSGFYEDDYTDCPTYYMCRCRIFLTFQFQIIQSSDVLLQPGSIILSRTVENVVTRLDHDQNATFGPYVIRKTYCRHCARFLGHRIVEVPPRDSPVVRGTYRLRKDRILKREGNQILDAETLQTIEAEYSAPRATALHDFTIPD